MGHGLIQMALELFGISGDAKPVSSPSTDPRQAPPRKPTDGRSRRLKPAADDSQDLWAEFSPQTGPQDDAPLSSTTREIGPAPEPLSRVLQPASFRHPQANREVLLGHARVAYLLSRVRRRSIGFVVDADGLSVRAPSWVTLGAIDDALKEKSDWILRKLGDAQLRQL